MLGLSGFGFFLRYFRVLNIVFQLHFVVQIECKLCKIVNIKYTFLHYMNIPLKRSKRMDLIESKYVFQTLINQKNCSNFLLQKLYFANHGIQKFILPPETRQVKESTIVLLYLNFSTLVNIEIQVLKQLHKKYFLKINMY